MTDPSKRTFCLIGHPVGHSLSPAIHQAAYAELGLTDCEYALQDCPDEASVRAVFARLRSGELAGANVTVPWKRLALELADEVDATALETGAANVIRAHGEGASLRLVAHNTDAPALAEELSHGRPRARSALVIGKGGAALAAVTACHLLGIRAVTITARGWKGSDRTTWDGVKEFTTLGAVAVAWPETGTVNDEWTRAVKRADLVVQATSDGMHGASDGTMVQGVVPWADVQADAFVYDVVYNPAVTPFVAAARGRSLRAESGLGMLVGQAILALELWLGNRPPALPLREAAERALREKMRG